MPNVSLTATPAAQRSASQIKATASVNVYVGPARSVSSGAIKPTTTTTVYIGGAGTKSSGAPGITASASSGAGSISLTATPASSRTHGQAPAAIYTLGAITPPSAQGVSRTGTPTVSTGGTPTNVSAPAGSTRTRSGTIRLTIADNERPSAAQSISRCKAPTLTVNSTISAKPGRTRSHASPPNLSFALPSSRKGDQPTSFTPPPAYQTGFTTQYSTGYTDVAVVPRSFKDSIYQTGEQDAVNKTGYEEVVD